VTRSRRNVAIAVALLIGLVVGTVLVVVGGDDATVESTTTSTTAAPDADPSVEDREPLPLEDVSKTAVAELTSLAFPAEASGFLTARLEDDRQLDITFVMPAAAVAAFVADSGLPQPEADQRVVIHSSPLWKLNPDTGAAVSGVSDTVDGVDRAVELVTEDDGSVRARIVITSAA
jgi:hypothetical protein